MSIAGLLRRYRAAARMTQEELAERAGSSARATTDLERGVRWFPYPDTVDRLANALKLGAVEREGLLRARRRVAQMQTLAGHASRSSQIGTVVGH